MKSTKWKSVFTALAASALLFGVAGCGGINDDDKVVCDWAYIDNQEEVAAAATTADNEDITDMASRITPRSSSEVDDAALTEIVKICADNGYTEKDSKKNRDLDR